MDDAVIKTFEEAGLEYRGKTLGLAVLLDADRKPKKLGAEVRVQVEKQSALLQLKDVRALFVGNAPAPSSSSGMPPLQYLPFIELAERTASVYCAVSGEQPDDDEFERVYRQLRRRPDGDDTILFSYVRAAMRLHMSLFDVSQAEYEWVVNRLSHSAKTFRQHAGSKVYFQKVMEPLITGDR